MKLCDLNLARKLAQIMIGAGDKAPAVSTGAAGGALASLPQRQGLPQADTEDEGASSGALH